jgi:hypothetical protein
VYAGAWHKVSRCDCTIERSTVPHNYALPPRGVNALICRIQRASSLTTQRSMSLRRTVHDLARRPTAASGSLAALAMVRR